MKIWFLIFFLLSCQKKNFDNKSVDFSKMYVINSTYDDKSQMLNIRVDLKEGVHAYGPEEKIGHPINFKVSEKNGWLSEGPVVFPKINGSLIKESFTISQKLRKGKGKGEGVLFLQLCTKDLCDMPKEYLIKF